MAGTCSAPRASRRFYLATSGQKEIAELTARLAAALATEASKGLRVTHATMPAETHATIFHPAALTAFRALFAPSP